MTERKKILIFSFSAIGKDPRVLKQIQALHEYYDLTVVGYPPAPAFKVTFIELPRPAAPPKWKIYLDFLKVIFLRKNVLFKNPSYIRAMGLVSGNFDLAIGNDMESLPVIFGSLRGKVAHVILDAHEYKPAQVQGKGGLRGFFYSRYWYRMSRELLPGIDYAWVVSQGILDLHKKRDHIKGEVLPNAFPFCDLHPTPVQPHKIGLVHHGGASRSRKLELMIESMKYLDEKYSLNFYLTADGIKTRAYLNELKEKASPDPRIHFHNPVPRKELPATINRYDLGIYLLPPANLNQEWALPNKIFEYIQARLAIVVGPSPEMKRVVQKYDIGRVSDDFTPRAFARAIASLSEENIRRMKNNSVIAAREESSERYETDVIYASVRRTLEQ